MLDRSSLGIRLIALLTLPAGFGLFVLRRADRRRRVPARQVHRGQRAQHLAALAGFALGLVGFSRLPVRAACLLRPQDARTPFVINVVENLINIVLALLFVGRWGVLGLGLSFALAYLLAAVWALQVLRYKVPAFPLQRRDRQLVAHGAGRAGDGRGRLGGRRTGRRQRRIRAPSCAWSCRPSSAPPCTSGMLLALQSPELDDLRSRLRARARLQPRPSRIRPMFKLLKKWWKYFGAKLNRNFESRADPAVQLEQALAEAQAQHRRLKEQAANVIASQKQSEMRLNSKMAELEKLNANARQALMMAADAQKAGDADQGRAVQRRRRDHRQPADPGREGRRGPEDDGPRLDQGLRSGQGRGRSRTAASCSRSSPRRTSSCPSSSRPRCRKR